MKPPGQQHAHPHGKKPKPRVGAGLSLEKFATAKASGYDKRKASEQRRALTAKRVNKYKKLKERLAREGRLLPPPSTAAALEQGPDGAAAAPAVAERTRVAASTAAEAAPSDRAAPVAGPASRGDQDTAQPGPSGYTHQPHDGRPAPSGAQGLRQGQPQPHADGAGSGGGEGGNTRKGGQRGKGAHREHKRAPTGLERLAAKVQKQKDEERAAREAAAAAAEAARKQREEAQRRRKKQSKAFYKKTRSGQPVMKVRIAKALDQLLAERRGGDGGR